VGVRRAVAAFALFSGALFIGPAATAGSPGPGTYTRITTPNSTKVLYLSSASRSRTFTVSGVASSDLKYVDIDCTLTSREWGYPVVLAAFVPVRGGKFSTTAEVSYLVPQCRMRALPSYGYGYPAYLASYSGPLLYTEAGLVLRNGARKVVGAQMLAEEPDGVLTVQDGWEGNWECAGVISSGTVAAPDMIDRGEEASECAVAPNLTHLIDPAREGGSGIKVDGLNAYTPQVVAGLLIGQSHLSLRQPPLSVRFTHGRVYTMRESGPLMRCSESDEYPPNATSCPSLVPTGVTYHRVITFADGAHQERDQESFTSSGAHRVSIDYFAGWAQPETGVTGFRGPGQKTFKPQHAGEPFHHLGRRAGTIWRRSNIYADEGDAQADTVAVSYSTAPRRILFELPGEDSTAYDMTFVVKVNAHATPSFVLAFTQAVKTATVERLVSQFMDTTVAAPVVRTPRDGAVVHGHETTVKGHVGSGANGRPTAVRVDGHRARLTPSGAFSVNVNEPYGKHRLRVVATDAAGNRRMTLVRIRNAS
jgi:hypothetical protein